MNTKIKNRILNILMGGSLFLLGATGLEGANRYRTQASYENLADARQVMEQAALPASRSDQSKTFATPLSNEPAAPEDRPGENQTVANQTVSTQTIPKLYDGLTENPNREMLSLNPDFLGWVKVLGTRIDYPYVRSQDNEDYLTLDFYRNPSKSGTLFMDYRNLGSFRDQHLLIYGHNMKIGTMFHDLVKFHDAAFYQANREITISDLYQTKVYRIFSVYEISADDSVLPFGIPDSQSLTDFLNDLASRSMHPGELITASTGQLLTLVTCSSGRSNGRTIIHALEMSDQQQ